MEAKNLLVEVLFTDEYTWGKNMLSKVELDRLSSICTKPIVALHLSKAHEKAGHHYITQKEEEQPEAKEMLDLYYVGGKSLIVCLSQLLALELPVIFKVVGTIKEIPEYHVQDTLIHQLVKFNEQLSVFDKMQQFNMKVGVHISDLGLLGVRHVEVLVDCCTDELQRYLKNGWRILAICPQADQRRPDYIMGRNDEED
jgi:hypothetical protein